MIQIRSSVFETNSSSVHSLVFMSESEYDQFVMGEMVYDRYSGKFIPASRIDTPVNEDDDDFYEESFRYLSKHNIAQFASECLGGEGFVNKKVTPDGHPVHYLCYYGRD